MTYAATAQLEIGRQPWQSLEASLGSPLAEESTSTDQQKGPALHELQQAFGQPFCLLDISTGEMLYSPVDILPCDYAVRIELCAEVGRRGSPEIIEDHAPLIMLAIPLPLGMESAKYVALSTFVTETVDTEASVASAADVFDADRREVLRWVKSRRTWPVHALLRLAEAVVRNLACRDKICTLQEQVSDISTQLLGTFEEITLLHRLTQHLSISGDIEELCELSTRWLADVIPAQCISVYLNIGAEAGEGAERGAKLKSITYGELPCAESELSTVIDHLGPETETRQLVLNRRATSKPGWPFPQITELVSVPIRESENVFGCLMAFNDTGDNEKTFGYGEFGTVEVSLMASVAVILGIHSGNLQLYREQSEFFESMVRAMTSAIDAKDPYTCGHSERVARLSVCLARQLSCTTEEQETLYLSGLLHDIGKIGIDTAVLRKPGNLTAEEYEHIQQHPELGYEILKGIKRLDQVLPVVLHHHEAWDGSGYPHGLRGEQCPKLARIAAVADSIDAMSSDRPYRQGMPDNQLDRILREGAGTQWEAKIIEAVFAVREAIREIGRSGHEDRVLDALTST